MEKIKSYNGLYNMVTFNFHNMEKWHLYQIITELIYTISESVKEEDTIHEINNILGLNEESEED